MKQLIIATLAMLSCFSVFGQGIPYIVNKGGRGTNATLRNTTLDGTTTASTVNATQMYIQTVIGTNATATISNVWDKTYPQFWGAVGNDSTDDTVPLQNLLANSSGLITLPIGTNKITAQIYPRSNQRIVGQGRNTVIHLVSAGTPSPVCLVGVTNVILENLTVRGSGAWAPGGFVSNYNCIDLYGSSNCVMRNVYVENFGFMGIHMDASHYNTVEGCWAGNCMNPNLDYTDDSAGMGIYGSGCFNKFLNCKVVGGASGVKFEGISGGVFSNTVDHCTITGLPRYGIIDYAGAGGSNGCNQITFNNVSQISGSQAYIDGKHYYGCGIYIAGSYGDLVVGNSVSRCSLQTDSYSLTPAGIGLNAAPATLINNNIWDCPWNGIYADDVGSQIPTNWATVIVGGNIAGSTNGIFVNRFNNVLVQGVTVSGSSNTHVLIGGVATNHIKNISVIGCQLMKSDIDGVLVQYSDRVKVHGNMVKVALNGVRFGSGTEDASAFFNNITHTTSGVKIDDGQTNAPAVDNNNIADTTTGVNNAFAGQYVGAFNRFSRVVAEMNGASPTIATTNLQAMQIISTNTTVGGPNMLLVGDADTAFGFGVGHGLFSPGFAGLWDVANNPKWLVNTNGQMYVGGSIQPATVGAGLPLCGNGAGGLLLGYGGGNGVIAVYHGTTQHGAWGADGTLWTTNGYFYGLVGIGTNNPQSVLHVNGGTISGGDLSIGNSNGMAPLAVLGLTGAPGLGRKGIGHFYTDAAINPGTGANVGLSVGGYITSPYAMWLQAWDSRTNDITTYPLVMQVLGGNVGIGTNNPQATLHVNGTLEVDQATNSTGTDVKGQLPIIVNGVTYYIDLKK